MRFSVCSLIKARLGSGKMIAAVSEHSEHTYSVYMNGNGNAPALLDLAPQHRDSLLVFLVLVRRDLELVLHPYAFLRDMLESLAHAFISCLCFGKFVYKGITFLRDVRQRQTKLGHN